jgi:hypothetical protein
MLRNARSPSGMRRSRMLNIDSHKMRPTNWRAREAATVCSGRSNRELEEQMRKAIAQNSPSSNFSQLYDVLAQQIIKERVAA